MNHRELLQDWHFPHLVIGGVILVARGDARTCLLRILAEECRLHGYDSFTLHDDGRIEPHMAWSASWTWDCLPPLPAMQDDLRALPEAVTHVEFVFSDEVWHVSTA